MNLYIYNHQEIKKAFLTASKEHGIPCMQDGKWLSIDMKIEPEKLFHLSYPSASLWHQKISELIDIQSCSLKEADFFVVPIVIFSHFNVEATFLMNTFCKLLPHWQYHNKRHIFFESSDIITVVPTIENSITFKVSCHKTSNFIPMHYDVLLDNKHISPIENAIYKCSFVGCLTTHMSRNNLPFCINNIEGETYFESTPNFFAKFSEVVKEKMQENWTDILNKSQFILCPRGNGLNSIRFFETLAFGRIPILISDNTKLPLEQIIDYKKFVIFLPEKDVLNANKYIKDFEQTNNLNEASDLAYKTWNNYFSRKNFYNFIIKSLENGCYHSTKKVFL